MAIVVPTAKMTLRMGEKREIGFKYKSPDLEAGETIAVVSVAVSPTGPGLGTPVADGDTVSVMFDTTGGTKGKVYTVTFTSTTSAGQKFINDWEIDIK